MGTLKAQQNSSNKYYVYAYLDPRKPGFYHFGNFNFHFEPFYIGMGTGERLYAHIKEARRKRTKASPRVDLIRKLLRLRLEPVIVKLHNYSTRSEAAEVEKQLITQIGRRSKGTGPLCNLGEGGLGGRRDVDLSGKNNGFYGKTHTEEVRRRISKAAKKQGLRGVALMAHLGIWNFSSTPEGRALRAKQIAGEKNPAAIAKREGRSWSAGENNVAKRPEVQSKIRKTRLRKDPANIGILAWLKSLDEQEIRLELTRARMFKNYRWLVLFAYDLRTIIKAFNLPYQVVRVKNNYWYLHKTKKERREG